MRRRFFQALMIAGAALLLGALLLFVRVQSEEARAGESAAAVMAELAGEVGAGTGGGDFEMSSVEVDGRRYVAVLEIPELGLELPVMSTWSYEQLVLTPCRYYGSTKTDNLVVAGFNYEAHFGRLGGVAVGDEVLLTDMDGVVRTYEVAEVGSLAASAVDEMTSSGYDLTLFTCSYDGSSRVCVRCERV